MFDLFFKRKLNYNYNLLLTFLDQDTSSYDKRNSCPYDDLLLRNFRRDYTCRVPSVEDIV